MHLYSRSICIKDQFSDYLPQLMQLEEGLSTCDILNSVQKFPSSWKVIFQPSDEFKLGADKFLDEVVVEYNNSQILREKEIVTYKSFCNVILLYDEGKVDFPCYDFKRIFIGLVIVRPVSNVHFCMHRILFKQWMRRLASLSIV